MKVIVLAVFADAIVDLREMRDHAIDERLGERPDARRGRAEFPKLVHAFGRAVTMQIPPEMVTSPMIMQTNNSCETFL